MKISRREFLAASASAAAVFAAGCDVAKNAGSALGLGPVQPDFDGPFTAPSSPTLDAVSHALNRFTFGPRPGDHARVSAIGVPAFLDEQLQPEKIDDSLCDRALGRFESVFEPNAAVSEYLERLPGDGQLANEQTMTEEMFEYSEKDLLSELTRATVMRATFSRRQLYEVMVQFWTDHFNIDASKGDCRWLKAADDLFVIRRNALGNFISLVRASALSPAMLWYLDGRTNRRRSPDEKPNENYARELLELHTLGVHGGYTQSDVMEVARCLTGWYVRSKEFLFKGKVEFHPKDHDDGAKIVLGEKIPAGGGARDLDRVLEIVTNHPSTANFLATKLCRRFIADEPPEAAVTATAAAFTRTHGDIRATLRALFATPEFAASAGTKLKRPFNYVVSALRATNAASDVSPRLIEMLVRMGHAPFRYPTPDGYPERASQWMGTMLWRWNFASALAEGRIGGTRIDLKELTTHIGDERALAATLLGRQASESEIAAHRNSGLAALLASPAFQCC